MVNLAKHSESNVRVNTELITDILLDQEYQNLFLKGWGRMAFQKISKSFTKEFVRNDYPEITDLELNLLILASFIDLTKVAEGVTYPTLCEKINLTYPRTVLFNSFGLKIKSGTAIYPSFKYIYLTAFRLNTENRNKPKITPEYKEFYINRVVKMEQERKQQGH